MKLSGTSIAHSGGRGHRALMLQANPGLTPGLVKAILQYTAQPLPNLVAHSARHGTTERRRRGARRGVVAHGHRELKPGDSLLATGASLPSSPSMVNGEHGRIGAASSRRAARTSWAAAPPQKYQSIYDTQLPLVRRLVCRTTPVQFPRQRDFRRRSFSAMPERQLVLSQGVKALDQPRAR